MRLRFRLLFLFIATLVVAILLGVSRVLSDGSVSSHMYWLLVLGGGALVGGTAPIAISLLQQQRTCPDCATRLPKLLDPFKKTRQQWLHGGWVCHVCGCKVNLRGRKYGSPTTARERR